MSDHVFISYSRRDSAYVDELVGDMEARGFNVWIDRSVEPGSEWISAITAAIDSCAVFVPVMSESSQQSRMVKLEVLHAIHTEKDSLPLRLDGDRWFLLRDVQDEDVRGGELPSEAWYQKLTHLIARNGSAPGRQGDEDVAPQVTFLGHNRRVRAVAWSPDARLIASGGEDNRVLVRDAASGDTRRPAQKHEEWVCALAWSPTGMRLASAGGEHRVFVSEVAGGLDQNVLVGHSGNILSVAWSSDGQHLASAGADAVVLVHPIGGGSLRTLEGHTDRIFSLSWSSGGQLASGSADGTMRLWDPLAGRQIATLPHGHQVRAVAFAPDGSQVATASAEPAVRVWEPYAEIVTATWDPPSRALSLCWSPDGRLLAIGCDDGTVQVWNPRTRENIARLVGNAGPVRAVAFAPGRRRLLATGGEDGAVRVWQLNRL